MSKRTLPGPHADRFAGVDFSMSSTPNETPQRATAAQLANRKIRELGKRRPRTTAPQSQTPFNFGEVGAAGTNDAAVAANSTASNGFAFGQSSSFPGASSNPTQNGSQPVTFGASGSSSFNFGFGSGSGSGSSNPFANLNGGGAQNQNQNTTGGLFNSANAPTTMNPPQGMFGATSQNPPSQLFGQSTTAASSAPPIFQSQPATTGASNLFGQASAAPASTSSSLFQPKPATSGPSLFGQSTPAAAGGSSLFGQSSVAPSSSSSLFQTQTQTTTAPSTNLFGKATPATSVSSAPLFGQSSATTTAPSSSIFQSQPTMGGSSTLFDQSSAAAPPPSASTPQPSIATSAPTFSFGQPASTTSSLFGKSSAASPAFASPNKSTAGSGPLFSQHTQSTNNVSTLLGQSNPSTSAVTNGSTTLFGKPQAPAESTFSFTPSTPSNSGVSAAQPSTAPQATANIFSGLGQPLNPKPLFGVNNEPDDMSTSPDAKPKTNGQLSGASPIFAPSASKAATAASSLFAPASSTPQPSSATSSFGSLFGHNPASTTPATPTVSVTPSKALFGGPVSSAATTEKNMESTTAVESKKPGPLAAFKPQVPAKAKAPSASFAASAVKTSSATSSGLTAGENQDFMKRTQIRDLNHGFKDMVASFDPDTQSLDDIILFYIRVRKTMNAPIGSLANKPSKRKLDETSNVDAHDRISSKKSRAQESVASSVEPSLPSLKHKRKASEDYEETSPTGKRRTAGFVRSATQPSGSKSTTAGIFANAFASGGSKDKESTDAVPSFKPSASVSAKTFGAASSTSTANKQTNISTPQPKKLPEPSTEPSQKPTFEAPKFGNTSGKDFLAQFGKAAGGSASKGTSAATEAVKLDVPKFGNTSGASFMAQFGKLAKNDDEDDDSSSDYEPEEASITKKTTEDTAPAPAELKAGASVFDNKPSAPSIAPSNIFGHLSNSNTNTDGDSSEDDLTEHLKKRASQSKPNLFDRIRRADGTPVQLSDDEKPATPKPQLFGQASANPFASLSASTSAPSSTATPSNGSNIFASKTPASGPFSSLAIPNPATHLFSGTATPSVTSDSNAEDTDTEPYKDTQLNLMGNAGEEGEECFFDGRSKGLKLVEKKSGDKTEKSWEVQGVGSLRVLVNKEANRARIVLRAEPSGRAVLNTAISRTIDYKIQGTTCTFPVPRADGSAMDIWTLRIKKEAASELETALKSAKESLPN
ncbi:hypothetical protein BGW36DRAFT_101859 [Talaromyces proteolyticus]|uniref:RanBD1 domain-containing protein n=1 Tax=Talaromyces proteolyticus TaxID=1131652 RepID=A0AAD4KY12_9EURO|nr:uncharacterized protein BGW36DRAFT_101859 [Talaromyces proteolyticus]KAH8701627.1 hypothetical protein BGW36DRAFT_101859 [Talaromyces proteolyticus]